MTAITIHHLHARLRVSPGDGNAAGRLKRLLGEVLQGALELALQRRGLDGRGELCIRRLQAPVRLDLASSDSTLVDQWALQMADAVADLRALDDGEMLRYGSRAHALADLTLAAASGDLARAWAWHRLGLWPAEGAVTGSDAAGLVLRALTAEPSHAVAALARLAGHPPRFERWWRQVSASGLEALVRTVLLHTGADTALALPAAAAPLRSATSLPHWLRHSAIARAAERLVRPAARLKDRPPGRDGPASSAEGWPASRALSLLAIAEAEPARLLARGAALAELCDELAWRWAPPAAGLDGTTGLLASPPQAPLRAQTRRPAPSPTGGEPPGAAHRLDIESEPEAKGASNAAPKSGSSPASMDVTQGPRAANESGAARRAISAASAPPPQPHEAGEPSAEDAPALSLPTRARAHTAFGGLLFLLNLATELGWPARWLDDPVLAARGTRWGMYQLGLRLLPLAGQRDSAALAFAGMLPDTNPPDAGVPSPNAAEETALAVVRGALLAALRARLPQAPEGDVALLIQVCQREGEILADPGWLELRVSLDEVRTEIRVAGLDLDPGWVPWLGLVIRFVYG